MNPIGMPSARILTVPCQGNPLSIQPSTRTMVEGTSANQPPCRHRRELHEHFVFHMACRSRVHVFIWTSVHLFIRSCLLLFLFLSRVRTCTVCGVRQDTPVQPTAVNIYETFQCGSVVRILARPCIARRGLRPWIELWRGEPQQCKSNFLSFSFFSFQIPPPHLFHPPRANFLADVRYSPPRPKASTKPEFSARHWRHAISPRCICGSR